MKLRLFELFRGYGSQALALKKYGIEFENVGGCEIDKCADVAHESIHGHVNNFGDITKVVASELPDHDLCTYSFPCQDISYAGKGKGLTEGSGTRSSLLWECERIIEAKKPKFLMMENVKALIGKKNMPDFESWLGILNDLGYNNYWQVVNALDCGIPQSRNRVFCISIRKDIDDGSFKFNEPFDNGKRIKDILDFEVPEKYYLSDEMTSKLIERAGKNGYINQNTQASKVMYPDNPKSRKSGLPTVQMLEVNKDAEISNCITTVQKDSLILIAKSCGCRIPSEPSKTIRVGGACSLTRKHNWDHVLDLQYRIRRLTPTECFRLMGLLDSEIEQILSTGLKDTALYKLAGNSIVVNSMAFLKNLPTCKFK